MNELTSCGCMIADVEEALVHEVRIDMMPLYTNTSPNNSFAPDAFGWDLYTP